MTRGGPSGGPVDEPAVVSIPLDHINLDDDDDDGLPGGGPGGPGGDGQDDDGQGQVPVYLGLKWTRFPGKNKFYCNGRLMTSPSIKFCFFSFFLILFTYLLFIIFDGPYLAEKLTIAIPIIGTLLFFIVIINMFHASCSDPGIIPRASNQEAEYIDRYYANASGGFRPPPRNRDIIVNGQTIKSKYCFTCKMFRPPRASHCGVCDNCVERFDHHCPFLGNCIGRRNYRSFYAFVVSLSCLAVFVLSCSIVHLVLLSKEAGNFLEALRSTPTSAIVVLISFFGMWTVIGLAGFHTYLIAIEQTTNEDIKGMFGRANNKNPYTRGNFCLNCCFILCGPIRPSLIDARGELTQDYIDSYTRQSVSISPNPNTNPGNRPGKCNLLQQCHEKDRLDADKSPDSEGPLRENFSRPQGQGQGGQGQLGQGGRNKQNQHQQVSTVATTNGNGRIYNQNQGGILNSPQQIIQHPPQSHQNQNFQNQNQLQNSTVPTGIMPSSSSPRTMNVPVDLYPQTYGQKPRKHHGQGHGHGKKGLENYTSVSMVQLEYNQNQPLSAKKLQKTGQNHGQDFDESLENDVDICVQSAPTLPSSSNGPGIPGISKNPGNRDAFSQTLNSNNQNNQNNDNTRININSTMINSPLHLDSLDSIM